MASYHVVLTLLCVCVCVCVVCVCAVGDSVKREEAESFHLVLAYDKEAESQLMLTQTHSLEVAHEYRKSKHSGEKMEEKKKHNGGKMEEEKKNKGKERKHSLHQLLPDQNGDLSPVEEVSVRKMYTKFKHKKEEMRDEEEEDDDDDDDNDDDDDDDDDDEEDEDEEHKEKEDQKKTKRIKEDKKKRKERKKKEKEENKKKKSVHNFFYGRKREFEMMPNEKMLKENSPLKMPLEEFDIREIEEKKIGEEKNTMVKEKKQSQHLALPNINHELNMGLNEQVFREIRPLKIPLEAFGLTKTYIKSYHKGEAENEVVEELGEEEKKDNKEKEDSKEKQKYKEKKKEKEQNRSLHLLFSNEKDESHIRPHDQMPLETHPSSMPLERVDAKKSYGKSNNKREKKKKKENEEEKEHDKEEEEEEEENEHLQFARKLKLVESFFKMFHVQTESMETSPDVEELWHLP